MYTDPFISSFDFSSLMGRGLIGLVIILVVFLILRIFALWYWRVNEIVDLLKEIRNNTKKEQKEEQK